MDLGYEDGFAPARVAVLLKEFSQLDDDREPWRVMYPLAEVLLLLTCATVASCDDFDDIVAFGEAPSPRPAPLRSVSPWRALRPLDAGAGEPGSTRCCSGPVSRAGSRPCGPTGTT